MAQVNAEKLPASDKSNPLSDLAGLLSGDMDKVNQAIMANMQSSVPLIPQLASYLIAAGGKRVRPLLTLASTQIFDGNMSRAHGLSASVEFIHTATLLHDDVVDESDQRRGQDSANLVFGNQASVLVGDFLFSRAFQLMVADGSLDILRILSDASAVIAEGEVLQLSKIGKIDITLDEYIEIISAKTAALFAAACEVGPVIADAGPEAAEAMRLYGLNMGIAFQIVDDALDYDAEQEKLGKTIGDDFREGKITAPVLFAIKSATPDELTFWGRVLRDKSQNEDDLQQAQTYIQQHNALDKSLALAHEYGNRAKSALQKAPEGDLRFLLEAIIDYTINRDF